MDWSKAKTILIILFLLMNIFLGVNVFNQKIAPVYFSKEEETAREILLKRGVILESDIPKQIMNSRKLTMEAKADFDLEKITLNLLGLKDVGNLASSKGFIENGNNSIKVENSFTFTYTDKSPSNYVNLKDAKDVEKFALEFIKKAGITPKGLILDDVEDTNSNSNSNSYGNSKRLVFIREKSNIKLFDSMINILISDKGVHEMTCSLPRPSYDKKDADRIMPAYKVLLQNFTKDSNVIILSVDLGYTMNEEDGDMKNFYERLTWRIKQKDGTVKYFDAVSGAPKNIW